MDERICEYRPHDQLADSLIKLTAELERVKAELEIHQLTITGKDKRIAELEAERDAALAERDEITQRRMETVAMCEQLSLELQAANQRADDAVAALEARRAQYVKSQEHFQGGTGLIFHTRELGEIDFALEAIRATKESRDATVL